MTDDFRSNGNGSRLSLGDVVDLLRDDAAAAELRGQRGRDELEGRLMAAIRQVSGQLDRYIEVHAGDHRATREATDAAHKRFDDFIATSSLAAARKDGALGVIRFVSETLGRNWRALAAIAAAIAAVSGAVHIDLGIH